VITLGQRLSNLYKQSHKGLIDYAFNITGELVDAEELVSDLYEYLMNRGEERLYWNDSFNIVYCQRFIHSRFINKNKRIKPHVSFDEILFDIEDEPYDVEHDQKLEQAYNDILILLNKLSRTKLWAPAKIFEIYITTGKTLEKTSKDLKLSKSTVFLAIKKIKNKIKEEIGNPYEHNN
jgi:DNA-directed RNA polymerase specialized sigma24 family protein